MAFARGKIKKPLGAVYRKYITEPNIRGDLAHSYQTNLDINKAHVLMLNKCGIMDKPAAAAVLAANRELADMGEKPDFEIDAGLEGLYFNLEKYVIDRAGLDFGGQQHTARSRNDLGACVCRMDVRRAYLDFCEHVLALRRVLIDVAGANTDAVMSGYTHAQPAEPVTFAHYLCAIDSGFERDYRRIAAVWEGMNLCPLGGGSMGSTTWGIDRKYVSDLLGFDAPMENSIDCVASRDYLLELTAAIAIFGNTMSRAAQDLFVWCGPDFGYLEVDDAIAVTSSIMPQKKNPCSLEVVKGKGGFSAGYFMGVFGAMKSSPYTNAVDVTYEAPRHIFEAIDEATAAVDLLAETIRTIVVHKDRMLAKAVGNFCTVTELANTLVRRDGISFRAAHDILAGIVNLMLEEGKNATDITAADVDRVFGELFHGKTTLTDEEIRKALDPVQNAFSKTVQGGTAQSEVKRQLAVLKDNLECDEALWACRGDQVRRAKASLEKAIDALLK